MPSRKQSFLAAEFSARFSDSYMKLGADRQRGVDKVVLALMKQETTPGMPLKPIQPEKYYFEARINDDDRLVYRFADGKVWMVDLVTHDDIGRYGKK